MKCNIWKGEITQHTYDLHHTNDQQCNIDNPTHCYEETMYLIQRIKDETYFSMMMYPSPQAAAGMWTTSKGFASWYPSQEAAKQLIDIKARNGEWDASALQIVPVRASVAA